MNGKSILRALAVMAILAVFLASAGCALFDSQVAVDFEASKTKGGAPLVVEFVAGVSGDVASYLWEFGDGEDSTDSSPVHVYRSRGVYDVSLAVTLVDGSTGTITKPDLIEVELLVRATPSGPSMLYWLDVNAKRIYRGDRFGNASEILREYVYDGADLAAAAGYIFWAAGETVYRADEDGRNLIQIAQDQQGLYSVTVNTVTQKLYWACKPSNRLVSPHWDGHLMRARLDGTGRTKIETYTNSALAYTWWVRSDGIAGRIYRFVDDDNLVLPVGYAPRGYWDAQLQYVDFPLPSTPVAHRVKGGLDTIRTMTIDIGAGPAHYVYWTVGGSIKRCRVDGSDTTTVLEDLCNPKGIAVDLGEGKMYWSDCHGIHRANLDGTEATLIFPDAHANVLVIGQ